LQAEPCQYQPFLLPLQLLTHLLHGERRLLLQAEPCQYQPFLLPLLLLPLLL
jgi:hypothetical protein